MTDSYGDEKQRTDAAQIVGLGLATVDILTATPRLPGPDDVFEVSGLALQGGGPAATALVAAAKLGASTEMVGTTDRGVWGDLIVREFAEAGVGVAHLQRRTDGVASRSVILIDGRSGQRSILYSKGTVAGLSVDEVPVDAISDAQILHLDGSHLDAALEAARVARDAGTLVSLDGGAGELWPGMDRLLPLVDVAVVARRFAENVTGFSDPEEAGPALVATGAQQVVITDGAAGAWYWQGPDHGHVPAFRIDPVDTTGAGDAFHGAFLHALLAGEPVRERVRLASAVAAMVCLHVGGRTGLPDRAGAEAFLAANDTA